MNTVIAVAGVLLIAHAFRWPDLAAVGAVLLVIGLAPYPPHKGVP